MSEVLEFIEVFSSPSNKILFKECACYWFSTILAQRFKNSTIMYDPHQVHFATEIDGRLYDIEGLIEDNTDYISWESYKLSADDYDLITRCCINLERR